MVSKNQIKLVRSLEQKKYRQREGLFVAEGPKVVGDLLAAGFEPHAVFATEEWIANVASQSASLTTCVSPYTTPVSPDELRKLSFLQHPQQVLAVFRLPSLFTLHPSPVAVHPSSPSPQLSHLELALDGIQDPGNLGTIIRLADWFGIGRIYCSQDTADAWSPKVVQATMGSIARVYIEYCDLPELLGRLTKEYAEAGRPLPVCGTVLDGENIYTADLPSEAVIVMGNEGNGISQSVRSLLTHRLLIPSFHPGPESLNVAIATAITCSEFRRDAASMGGMYNE